MFKNSCETKKTALILGSNSLSYADLNWLVVNYANYLKTLACNDQPIVIMGTKSISTVVVMLAAHYSGRTFSVLSQDWTEGYIKSALTLLSPIKIFIPDDNQPINQRLIRFFDERKLLPQPFKMAVMSSSDDYSPELCQPAYIYFTSGSTGQPKAAVISRNTMEYALKRFDADIQLCATDTIINQVDFSFDLSIFDIFATLGNGGTLILCARSESMQPSKFKSLILQHEVSSLLAVPSYIEYLFQCNDDVLLPLKQILLSGEAVKLDHINKVFNHTTANTIWNLYGGTEMPYVLATSHKRNDKDYRTIFPVNDAPPIEINDNELWVGEPAILSKYLSDEHTQTKLCLKNNLRWYKTGDRAQFLGLNFIELLGRTDRIVKINGRQIDLDEIEFETEKLDHVLSAACLIDKNSIILFYSASDEINNLKESLQIKFPNYMLPTHIYYIKNIPRTRSGKKDRKMLLSQIMNSTFSNIV